MNSSSSPDYYKILEIDRTADEGDIKRAFRRLSLKNHPDKNSELHNQSENTEKFKEIVQAYEILGNPEKRRQHDIYNGYRSTDFYAHKDKDKDKNMSFSLGKIQDLMKNQSQEIGPMDLFNMLFSNPQDWGSSIARNPGHPLEQDWGLKGTHPLEQDWGLKISHNTAHSLGQDWGLKGAHPLNRPDAINKTLEITLEQAFAGCILPIEIERIIHENNMRKQEIETLYVAVPKGVDNNELILLKDKGHILSNILCGDVKVYIKVLVHSNFERNGINLIYNKNISLRESLCGFSFPIKHIDSRAYIINNESGKYYKQ